MKKLSLNQLLEAAQENQNPTISKVTQQFLTKKSQKVKELPLREQLKIKRQSTYRNTQQEMDKWIGIVKHNRQKQTLNFAKKQKDNSSNVAFFPQNPISKLQQRLDGQLKGLAISSQKQVLKAQQQILQQMSKQQAQQRLRQARKQRAIQFSLQIKQRRMAKIKSKLYRRIKKKQKLREQAKRISALDGQQKKQYQQKMIKQRIHQRITLRHSSKNKHIQSLLRFSKGDKEALQKSMNQVNNIRHQQLQKINQIRQNDSEDDMIDQNESNQNLQQLQKQIDEMQKQQTQKPKTGLDSMKFMKLGAQKEMQANKKQTKKLISALVNDTDIIQSQNQQIQQEQIPQKGISRKNFGNISSSDKKQDKNINFMHKNLRQALGNSKQLVSGINIDKLKDKYQPERPNQINIQNQENNQVILQNYKQFQANKQQQFISQLPQQPKKLKGWGIWAGPGISEPKIDHAAEVKKKLAQIEAIKKKRRDGQMSGAIIRQAYNRNLKDYFVTKLPHNFSTPQQFQYTQSQKIGPQWNSLKQFSQNVKPKVITKAGQVIQPIKMPKTIQKKH